MLGEKYATMDQELASGEITRTEYAAALLGDILNRAVPFCTLVDSYLDHDHCQDATLAALRRFEADCREAVVRGGRAGLFVPGTGGLTFPGPVSEADVQSLGGLLVPERKG